MCAAPRRWPQVRGMCGLCECEIRGAIVRHPWGLYLHLVHGSDGPSCCIELTGWGGCHEGALGNAADGWRQEDGFQQKGWGCCVVAHPGCILIPSPTLLSSSFVAEVADAFGKLLGSKAFDALVSGGRYVSPACMCAFCGVQAGDGGHTRAYRIRLPTTSPCAHGIALALPRTQRSTRTCLVCRWARL